MPFKYVTYIKWVLKYILLSDFSDQVSIPVGWKRIEMGLMIDNCSGVLVEGIKVALKAQNSKMNAHNVFLIYSFQE